MRMLPRLRPYFYREGIVAMQDPGLECPEFPFRATRLIEDCALPVAKKSLYYTSVNGVAERLVLSDRVTDR